MRSLAPADANLNIRIPAALIAAARKTAAANREPLSTLVRRALAREVGAPALALTRLAGQPRKTA